MLVTTPNARNGPVTNTAAVDRLPRTGKRGVPQQFPRRLYEMIETESNNTPSNAVIRWSGSGRAFHIDDTQLFSSEILPKYFRTNKFSSFQRNLNLYGFTKVRRGPDTDMYAHPSFIRGHQEAVAQLRKGGGSSSNSSSSRSRSPAQAQQHQTVVVSKLVTTPSPATVSIASSRSNSFSSTMSSAEQLSFQADDQLRYQRRSNTLFELQNCSRNNETVSYQSHSNTRRFAHTELPLNSTKACNKLALLTLALSSLADTPCP